MAEQTTSHRKLWLSQLVVLVYMALQSVPLLAGIKGSVHDFTAQGWTGGQSCVACHTVQNEDHAQNTQLWDISSTLTEFSAYKGALFNENKTTAGATSSLCLSCHDGLIASDILGNPKSREVNNNQDEQISTKLTADHPLTIIYHAATVRRNRLHSPDQLEVEIGSQHQDAKNDRGTITELLLVDGRIQCGSCHDVHNNYIADDPLLKMKSSALCLACHNQYHIGYKVLEELHDTRVDQIQQLLDKEQIRCDHCHDVHDRQTIDTAINKVRGNDSLLCLKCHRRARVF